MKLWRWRTVLRYFILTIVLFGVSGYTMSLYQEKSIGKTKANGSRGIEEKVQTQSALKEQATISSDSILTIPELEAAALAKANLELSGIKEVKSKSIKDFPSPVLGEPIRKPGNYYSETLQAYIFHAGTDYAQAEGAVIRIKHSGKVTYAGPDPLLGQKVEIDHGDNWSTVYGGLENLRVKEGDYVEVNQAIGQVGYYPNADGVKEQPQLHYEIWHGDEVVIPDVL